MRSVSSAICTFVEPVSCSEAPNLAASSRFLSVVIVIGGDTVADRRARDAGEAAARVRVVFDFVPRRAHARAGARAGFVYTYARARRALQRKPRHAYPPASPWRLSGRQARGAYQACALYASTTSRVRR